jgi:osmotically-inducible protein OsmY
MASHHEIIDFIENIRAEIPAHLHGFYEEAVDRALEQQHKRGKEFARQIIEHNPMIRREFDHQKEEEGLLAIFVLIIGFLGGAALMYLFDPERGEQRRASFMGQVNHAEHSVMQAAGQAEQSVKHATDQVRGETNKVIGHASDTVKDNADQASKAVSSASASTRAASEQVNNVVSDATLSARVRVEIAKDVRAPGSIEVTVKDGVVSLKGPVMASEVKGLIEKLQATPGVKSVENRLEVHDATTTTGGAPSGAGTAPGSNGTPR